MKQKETVSIETEGAYLNRLGKKLLRYFPLEQVQEILEDYQEHFSLGRERGGTDGDLISALGTPESVTAAILKEMPEGRSYCIRHTIRWGILLALSCCCLYLRYSFYNSVILLGTYTFMILGPISVFALLHGRGQAAIEGRYQQSPPKQIAAAYLLPLISVICIEGLAQYFASAGEKLPNLLTASQIGTLFYYLFESARIVFPLLLLWLLWRSCRISVWSFPAAISVLGTIVFSQEMERILHNMKVDYSPQYLKVMIAGCLLPYAFSILLAVLFRQYIRHRTEA